MKRSSKKEKDGSAKNMRTALATAATVLGVSLGVNVGPAAASIIGFDAFSLTADQYKLNETYQFKESIQMKFDVDPSILGSNQFKFDIANLKLDTTQIKIDIATQLKIDLVNHKIDLSNYVYLLPADVSPTNPFLIPFSDFPLDPLTGEPILSFLTIGIESFAYNVNSDGLLITSVVRKPVPEPASLLLLGAGLAALFGGRRLIKR